MGPYIQDAKRVEVSRRRRAHACGLRLSTGETHEIAPGKAYTVTFNEPDLWGDEAKPHPRGLYRVVFLFYHELTIEEALLGNLACPLRANPVTFAEK